MTEEASSGVQAGGLALGQPGLSPAARRFYRRHSWITQYGPALILALVAYLPIHLSCAVAVGLSLFVLMFGIRNEAFKRGAFVPSVNEQARLQAMLTGLDGQPDALSSYAFTIGDAPAINSPALPGVDPKPSWLARVCPPRQERFLIGLVDLGDAPLTAFGFSRGYYLIILSRQVLNQLSPNDLRCVCMLGAAYLLKRYRLSWRMFCAQYAVLLLPSLSWLLASVAWGKLYYLGGAAAVAAGAALHALLWVWFTMLLAQLTRIQADRSALKLAGRERYAAAIARLARPFDRPGSTRRQRQRLRWMGLSDSQVENAIRQSEHR